MTDKQEEKPQQEEEVQPQAPPPPQASLADVRKHLLRAQARSR